MTLLSSRDGNDFRLELRALVLSNISSFLTWTPVVFWAHQGPCPLCFDLQSLGISPIPVVVACG